ncbi:MAG: thiamine phosphate synthase [Blastocatellia bacterium]
MSLPRHQPLLYLITNRQAFRRNPEISDKEAWQLQIEAIRLATAAGCQLIQIRERDISARALTEFTREAIAVARPHGAKVFVNDRLDVAIAAKADGVHLRVTSLAVADIREVTKSNKLGSFLIGASTHSLAEAIDAQACGADFIVYGPVYDTPSKREYGSPLGLEKLAEVCRMVGIPVLTLGGITLKNFRQPLRQGASGIAAIGLFTDLPRLQTAISTILNLR